MALVPGGAVTRPRDPFAYVFAAAALAFAALLLANAWVVDDAYITMRTVDNWVNGYGLTWNTSERVQAYTHPLWMLVLSALYFFTRESFFTIVAASFAIASCATMLAASIVTRGWRADAWKAALLLLALTASKAVIDYTSSGLENPLSYLVAALFMRSVLDGAGNESGGAVPRQPFLWASLAYLCRPDSALLYIPALAWVLARSRAPWRRAVAAIFVATLPATIWTLFSIVYYGFPFPNTAYAKSFVSGIPFEWKVERGIQYLGNSVHWDAASYAMAAAALGLALRRRSAPAIALMAGVVVYVAGVVVNFASATHMSGRLLALPLFICIVAFVRLLEDKRLGALAAAALAGFIAWSPVSAPKLVTGNYRAYPQNENFIDTKWYVYNEGAGLMHWRPGLAMPDHDWYRAGEAMRASPQRVFVGGPAGVAIGYAGFAAGPRKFIIDRVGLSDPLLARLPARTPTERMLFKSGHFQRFIPEGYVESVERDTNAIANPDLAKYYGVIRSITRGPIFRVERFREIVDMNLGRYDAWLRHPTSPGDIPAAPR